MRIAMRLNIILLIMGAGLTACSFGIHKVQGPAYVDVRGTEAPANVIDSIVSPYKLALEKEMNQTLAKADVDFVNAKPTGNLGNLVADGLLTYGRTLVSNNVVPVVCVLNYGGLRAPLNQGDITLGDIYKVLPFDNQLVVAYLPKEQLPALVTWLKKNGGHPIAGFHVKGEHLYSLNGTILDQDMWIVTSDYLLNGGDHADFFAQRSQLISPNELLREVFINFVKAEGVLKDRSEQRIQLN